MSKKPYAPLLLILLAAVFVYSPALKNKFIWDDFHLVINDGNIKSFQNLPLVFKSHLFRASGGSNFYRPLQTVSFMIDHAIWKFNPFGYHLTNLIFHLFNAALIYFFINRVFNNPGIGICAAAIFGIHPINTEAVTYISGRADPISAFFFLSALLFYIRFRDRHKRRFFFFSILFFGFALLVKESVLVFPLVIILYDMLIMGEQSVTLRSIKLYAPYLLALLIYIYLRFFVLGVPLGFAAHIPVGSLLVNAPRVIASYLGLLFFPVNLHMEMAGPAARPLFSAASAASLGALICGIWFLRILLKRSKPLFFCAAFFLITLLPMLNILTLNAVMAEHWVYLPSIGVYAIISFVFVKSVDLRKSIAAQTIPAKAAIAVFILFLGFFSIRAVIRNMEWGRPFEFYKNMVNANPYSTRGRSNIGSMYIAAKNFKSARQEFQKNLEIDPRDVFSCYALGFLDILEDKEAEASDRLKECLDISPFYEPARKTMNLLLYRDDKRFRMLLRAGGAKPKNIMANYRLSAIYMKRGLYIEALAGLKKVLEADPGYVDAIFNRAWLYSKLGLYEKAINEYKKTLALKPGASDVYMNLSLCYAALNRHKEAREMRQKALSYGK